MHEGRQEIRRLVEDFERLDRQLGTTLARGDVEAAGRSLRAAIEAKRRIKLWLLSSSSAWRARGELAASLRKIRNNRGYNVDAVSSGMQLTGSLSAEGDWEPPADGFYWELEASFAMDEANPIMTRASRCGALVVGQGVPQRLIGQFHEASRAFALGLFNASVILCRALLEVAIFEYLARRGRARRSNRMADVAEYRLSECIRRLSPELPLATVQGIRRVVGRANRLLHSKRTESDASEDEAFRALATTIALVERLFS